MIGAPRAAAHDVGVGRAVERREPPLRRLRSARPDARRHAAAASPSSAVARAQHEHRVALREIEGERRRARPGPRRNRGRAPLPRAYRKLRYQSGAWRRRPIDQRGDRGQAGVRLPGRRCRRSRVRAKSNAGVLAHQRVIVAAREQRPHAQRRAGRCPRCAASAARPRRRRARRGSRARPRCRPASGTSSAATARARTSAMWSMPARMDHVGRVALRRQRHAARRRARPRPRRR